MYVLKYSHHNGMECVQMARKTETSSEVKMRWMAENYKTYRVSLRYDKDQDLIDLIEKVKSENDGFGVTDVFRKALRALLEQQ